MKIQTFQDLGTDLILRRATPADSAALSDFNARIHSDLGPEQPDEGVRIWTTDLLERPHPTFKPADFTIVEDTKTGAIISSLNLISQTWTYGDIEFKVGRPELVGTLPEYRNRGLVRAQFDLIHRWSAGRGEKVQAITGIPYYYRLFGYEMAMDLGGGRVGFNRFVPKLKEGETEPYGIRQAEIADLSFLQNLYQQSNRRYLINCIRNQEQWFYELNGKSPTNGNRSEIQIIETPQGQPVGYFTHPPYNWGPNLAATQYEISAGLPWSQITPSVVRFLHTKGREFAIKEGKADSYDGFAFWLGREHPVYEVLRSSLPRIREPYAWYLRVPDLVGFLRHIAPVMETNLAASPYQGYTGSLKITFYRDGVKLDLERGRLVKIESYQPEPVGHTGDAAFPGLTFLQMVFGYRTLEEIHHAFADCWYENDTVFGVLEALFPKRPCNLWPIS